MFKVISGIGIAAIGWGVLLFFADTGARYSGGVINLHKVAIANNLILLGYVCLIWGVIEEGFQRIHSGSSQNQGSADPQSGDSASFDSLFANPVETPVFTNEELAAKKAKLTSELNKMKNRNSIR